eukprot:NODE_5093_length_700_cov_2.753927_g4930_i0.p2 GENE.NODE_5093_length_700_cov_2.753927_g4930_i0~~NODE_5093_length_700_cov_2.753927_g4930_i0.p2  ORF type:complete len:174 (-),score=44.84 NODE_5093_length_700_cov_2.753927_g4930_i0:177-698(-)
MGHFLSVYFFRLMLKEIFVTLHSATGLKNVDSSWLGQGVSDPFVEVVVGPEKRTTRTIDNDLNPVWEEQFMLPASEMDEIEFIVMDSGTVKDTPIGACKVGLSQLSLRAGPVQQKFTILDNKEKPAGVLLVTIEGIFGPAQPITQPIPTASLSSPLPPLTQDPHRVLATERSD